MIYGYLFLSFLIGVVLSWGIWENSDKNLDDADAPSRQFVRKLAPYDGQYRNYFCYGGLEADLKRGRLIQRFDTGENSCVLLFESIKGKELE